MKVKLVFYIALLFPLLVLSCKQHHGALNEVITSNRESANGDITAEPFIANIEKHPVDQKGKQFYIKARQPEIMSYPCAECHTEPVTSLKNNTTDKTHWGITLEHAPADVMDCKTCHAGNNMNSLHSSTGSTFSFNDSYKLCAQCHTGQFNDWLGGAHSKRVGSWAPPRVSYTCTNCHDPHSPVIKSRWPAYYKAEVN